MMIKDQTKLDTIISLYIIRLIIFSYCLYKKNYNNKQKQVRFLMKRYLI